MNESGSNKCFLRLGNEVARKVKSEKQMMFQQGGERHHALPTSFNAPA